MAENEVAKSKAELVDRIRSGEIAKQIAAALPKHIKSDFMLRVVVSALNRQPDLVKCDWPSMLKCMLELAQVGLPPDGRLAHLIPRAKRDRSGAIVGYECTYIIDYKGVVELAMRSGNVSLIFADKVCENDDFEVDRGEVVKHKIDYRKDRGAVYAYWARVRFKDGTERSEVMTLAEVNAIRQRSPASKNGPWVSDFDEMAKKTVFKRLSKWIQLSAEIREHIHMGDDGLDVDGEVIGSSSRPTTLSGLQSAFVDPRPAIEHHAEPEPLEVVHEARESVPVAAPKAKPEAKKPAQSAAPAPDPEYRPDSAAPQQDLL